MLCARRCLRPYPGEATELRAFDTGRNRLAPPPATLPARAYFGCQPLRVPASAYSVAATDCLGLNMRKGSLGPYGAKIAITKNAISPA